MTDSSCRRLVDVADNRLTDPFVCVARVRLAAQLVAEP